MTARTPTPEHLEAEICRRAASALSSVPTAGEEEQAPEGWVLVPKEPTEAMIRAFAEASWKKREDGYSQSPTEHPEDGGGSIGYGYRAMLAASPAQPVQGMHELAPVAWRGRTEQGPWEFTSRDPSPYEVFDEIQPLFTAESLSMERNKALEEAAKVAKYGMERAQRDFRTASPFSHAHSMAEEIHDAILSLKGDQK